MIHNILEALRTIRVPAMPEEYDIHNAIAEALNAAGISCIHEAKLGPGCRIDFLCGDIGIEIKKGRPKTDTLHAQISRYLAHEQLSAIIVVLQKPCGLSKSISGKPVYCVELNRLWGVALP